MTVLRVCFVGDSITIGTGDDDFLGWPGRLMAAERAKGHDVTQYNLGIRGDTSALIAPRWRRECEARVAEGVPTAILFAFGINDSAVEGGVGIRVPLASSLANARAILSEAKAWLPVSWVGPTPADESKMPMRPRPGVSYAFDNARIAEYDAAYKALAAEMGVPYLDLFTEFAGKSPFGADLGAGDGVHPLRRGYALIARAVERWPSWRAWLDR